MKVSSNLGTRAKCNTCRRCSNWRLRKHASESLGCHVGWWYRRSYICHRLQIHICKYLYIGESYSINSSFKRPIWSSHGWLTFFNSIEVALACTETQYFGFESNPKDYFSNELFRSSVDRRRKSTKNISRLRFLPTTLDLERYWQYHSAMSAHIILVCLCYQCWWRSYCCSSRLCVITMIITACILKF